jgi:uncharacterized protein (DUF2249 family)
MSHADQSAAQAVVRHHAQLAAGLDRRVEALVELVDSEYLVKAESARQDLLAYLRGEILPHARVEEEALYPPAAADPTGRLLVEGMIAEHRALAGLVTELSDARSLVRAAAAGRAFGALFAVHLAKENDLVLPLLLAAPDVSLADVLAGMHDMLGAGDAGAADEPATAGCGCGGCGCGGDQPAASAEAPVLSVDTRLDVRHVPHDQRHALVLSTVAALPPGDAVVLVASHAPRPVLREIDDRFGGQVRTQWLQSGPDTWQVRLERVATGEEHTAHV